MYVMKTLMAMAVFCLAAFVHAEININTATVQQLTELHNIGAMKAVAIVEYRTQHGHFQSVDDLLKVDGIGLATIEANRKLLTVGVEQHRTTPTEAAKPKGERVTTKMHAPKMEREK